MAKPTKVAEAAENMRKTCFFITPISSDNSDIRRTTDGLIDSVLEPLLEEFNIELVSPHRISKPGSITSQVIKLILNSDLVIANLTTLNPNVMYELAVRHATGKQVICIAENGTHLPFDINPERTFFFKNDMMGVKELKETLQKALPEALQDEEIDNPITREIREAVLTEKLKRRYNSGEESPSLIEFFNTKFDTLEAQLNQRLFDRKLSHTSQKSVSSKDEVSISVYRTSGGEFPEETVSKIESIIRNIIVLELVLLAFSNTEKAVNLKYAFIKKVYFEDRQNIVDELIKKIRDRLNQNGILVNIRLLY